MYKINREFEIERRKEIDWNRGYGDMECVNVNDAGSCVILAALRKIIGLEYRAIEVEVDLKALVIRFKPAIERSEETTKFINHSYMKTFSITAKLSRAFNEGTRKRLVTNLPNGFVKVNELSIVYQVHHEGDWYVIRPFK